MFALRSSEARGHANFGWLQAKHSFSFGRYFDPAFMGFRSLRVINQDIVAPSSGFETHGHKDMEIITYVLHGAVAHKDSMGQDTIIQAGDVQIMSAGTGVEHSEFNPSATDELELLQIWLLPNKKGVAPRYQQQKLQQKPGLELIASGSNPAAAMNIYADADLYAGHLAAGAALTQPWDDTRFGWLQLIKGELQVAENQLRAGDGLAFGQLTTLPITALQDSEFLLFDLA